MASTVFPAPSASSTVPNLVGPPSGWTLRQTYTTTQGSVSFPVSQVPGRVVVEAEHVTKSYGDKTILKDISLLVERGSKIAFVGQNGQGKSTFIKAIVNEFEYEGNVKLGHNVQLGYFAQNQAEYLNGEITLLDTMLEAATDSNRSKVRDMLGSFLFRGDDVEKKVKVLSGGERNRFHLAMTLKEEGNVLLLDEPTNDLDVNTLRALEEGLENFAGCAVVISHDRWFLDRVCTHILAFEGNSEVYFYEGSFSEYEENKKQRLGGDLMPKRIKYKKLIR